MEFTDLNPHGGIGANCVLARIGPFKLLIDCGLHPKKLGPEALPDFAPLEGVELDLIVLTHCHLDHLGALPLVAARYPDTPLITSVPNLSLAPRMLRNSVNVMKRQREEHGITEYPFFVQRDVSELAKRLSAQRFGRPTPYHKQGETLELVLHPAGHVGGAAAAEFRHSGRRHLFSGDVLFDAQRTLRGARLPDEKLETLVLETTRGAKAPEPGVNRASETERLIRRIAGILGRGGSCLIPVFALGRMQEMFKILFEARNAGHLPKCPVYAAGLGMDLSKYFETIRRRTRLIDFDSSMLERMKIRDLDQNMRPGRDLAQKGIYLVSSGMMVENTPSYKVAASLLAHPKNGLCFVGYCDPDTPGGKLLAERGAPTFFFEALDFACPVRASIDQFDLSGHADRAELADFAELVSPRTVVLTHGDPEAREWFKDTLPDRLPEATILDPEPLERYCF